ncbi:amidohydrolase family protein [Marilutibacter maris]|uniref:Amidohydrolase n=1 Tax=Marilutibacter maris TaxID=1605891 RepID=A0A2U9TBT6_9GAMM|nr:amidohydrolase family protein [Lysobacter maris]AWV08657.1 amidohydrolase [Lysobacter maris]KAB8194353.1 amidohydrolase family protein [Lysobacter maris]
MKRLSLTALAAAVLALASAGAPAQDLLVRNARVHTATAQGTLDNADVLIGAGTIRAIGNGLAAPAGVRVVDAGGRPLTPTLFGGITEIGLEEVSAEESTVDASLALGAETKQMVVRPEFDVTLAYNPASVLIPVSRIEGIGWTLLGAGTPEGGSIIGGQGGVVRLDGSADPIGNRVLFVRLGSQASGLSGKSRAAQWMLLDQLIDEARGRIPLDANSALLTPAGRRGLLRYLDGGGRVMVGIDRAADIRQLLRWSKRQNVRIAIAGGAEAWQLAADIAAAKVPVFVDPLANLPSSFDAIHSSFENAARLAAAGVQVGFSQGGDASHNARKIRQLAGNAVAHGLPWEQGLAGLTTVPAQALGVADRVGAIAVGRRADLVLWSGDPLEVDAVALQVWMNGQAVPMRSRQTELRDRYLRPQLPRDQGGLPRAYPAGGE